jgi:hypothetical protein
MPTIFVCVYRRHVPSRADWRQTFDRSRTDLRLTRFLAEYWRDDRYYDWGDDPAFFCAKDAFGDPRRASWAVCRRDVRNAVGIGDAVVFVVAKPAVAVNSRGNHLAAGPVDYFYIGCGTANQLVDRHRLWFDERLLKYRDFYNALARPGPNGDLENIEVFPRHADWERRAAAPIVLFDPETSQYNLDNPRHVAHFDPAVGVPERWNADPTSRRLETLLFGDGRPRRLRTSHTGYGHAKRVLRPSDDEFGSVRDELVELARSV